MKKLKSLIGIIIAVSAVLLFSTCTTVNCPECEDCDNKIDTIVITDSAIFSEMRLEFLLWRDSVDARKKFILDSLVVAAMDEVTIYRDESIYQIDTMRTNFLAWMENIKGLKIYENMIVLADSTCGAEVRFDNNGKPYIKLD